MVKDEVCWWRRSDRYWGAREWRMDEGMDEGLGDRVGE